MTRCASCGADNGPEMPFCSECQQFLGWANPPAAPPVSASVTLDPKPTPAVPDHPGAPDPSPRTRPPLARPTPTPAPLPTPATAVPQIVEALDAGRDLATSSGRDDLQRHLDRTEARLANELVPVAVTGESNQGKSTLVNAILQHAVCPVDADVATAVPTVVRYAATPRVTTFVVQNDGSRAEEREMPLDSLPGLVTEPSDPGEPARQRSVEVGLPHRMLRSGLTLVDTPGVGGLDSAHGLLALGSLRGAKGMLFVTDASQELTGPELSFLKTAAKRCGLIALVVTKIDLYPQWRRIVELDRAHLAAAGLPVPVIPLSSFLRLRAADPPVDHEGRAGETAAQTSARVEAQARATAQALNRESGFAELVAFLARDVVAASRAAGARAAAAEVEFVATQLAQQAEAERAVLAAPEQSAEVLAELAVSERQARWLASPTATWQQTLTDGIQDLVSDVEHDLQARLRTALKEAEEVIDQSDPKESWEQTETWLRRNVAQVMVANRDLLSDRAIALTETVAAQFDMPTGRGSALPIAGTDGALDAVALAPAAGFALPGGKLAPLLAAARSSFYLPMMLGSVAAGALGAGPGGHLLLAGAGMTLGAGIGKRIIHDERQRQLTYRQQQAKAAVRKFVDDVAFRMNKQTRDCLSATQRQLRNDFAERAMLLERSARHASATARRAAQLDERQQRDRGDQVADQGRRVERLRATARSVAEVRAA